MSSFLSLQSIALQPGDIQATLVNAATGTGTGASLNFTIGGVRNEGPQAYTLTMVATGTFTVATATLQYSKDGGNTWNTYSTADTGSDFHAAALIQWKDLVPGLLYRITMASFTGTSITITGAIA